MLSVVIFLELGCPTKLAKVFATLIHAEALYSGAFKPVVKANSKQYF